MDLFLPVARLTEGMVDDCPAAGKVGATQLRHARSGIDLATPAAGQDPIAGIFQRSQGDDHGEQNERKARLCLSGLFPLAWNYLSPHPTFFHTMTLGFQGEPRR